MTNNSFSFLPQSRSADWQSPLNPIGFIFFPWDGMWSKVLLKSMYVLRCQHHPLLKKYLICLPQPSQTNLCWPSLIKPWWFIISHTDLRPGWRNNLLSSLPSFSKTMPFWWLSTYFTAAPREGWKLSTSTCLDTKCIASNSPPLNRHPSFSITLHPPCHHFLSDESPAPVSTSTCRFVLVNQWTLEITGFSSRPARHKHPTMPNIYFLISGTFPSHSAFPPPQSHMLIH